MTPREPPPPLPRPARGRLMIDGPPPGKMYPRELEVRCPPGVGGGARIVVRSPDGRATEVGTTEKENQARFQKVVFASAHGAIFHTFEVPDLKQTHTPTKH